MGQAGNKYADDKFKDRAVLHDGPCEQCGLPHGEHEAWDLVFSDDPPEVVEKVLSGEINRVICQECGYDGGWLWPYPAFLYVDLNEERGVLVSLEESLARWDARLDAALSHPTLAAKSVNKERLRVRCAAVFHYRRIWEALNKPVEIIEIENRAATAATERGKLSGHERVRKLLETALATGGVVLSGEEISEDFLYLLRHFSRQNYESLSEQEKQFLDRTIVGLEQRFSTQRPQREREDQPVVPQLDQILRLVQENHQNVDKFFEASFSNQMAEAEQEVYRDHLDFLLEVAAVGYLPRDAVRPIDFAEGFRKFAEAELGEAAPLGGPIPAPAGQPVVRKFLDDTQGVKSLFDTFEFSDPRAGGLHRPSDCDWDTTSQTLLNAAEQDVRLKRYELALRKLHTLRGRVTGGSSPAYEGQMYLLLGDAYRGLGKPDESEACYEESLRLAGGASDGADAETRRWLERGAGVSAERLGDLMSNRGLLDHALELYDLAMRHYREAGAIDGLENCCRNIGGRLLDLWRIRRAEGYLRQAVEVSRGRCDADEVRNLVNLANALLLKAKEVNLPEMVMKPATETENGEGGDGGPPPDEDMNDGAEQVEAVGPGRADGEVTDSVRALREVEMLAVSLGLRVALESPEESDMPTFHDILGGEMFNYMHRAIKIAEVSGQNDLHVFLLGYLAEMYYGRHCVDKAAWLLRRIEKLGTSLARAGSYSMFVGAMLLIREAQRADELLDTEVKNEALWQALNLLEAIREMRSDARSPDWNAMTMPDSERVRLDWLIGECYESLGDFEKAHDVYERACAKFEDMRNLLTEADLKRGIQTERVGVYAKAAHNLYAWHKASKGDGPSLAEVVNKVDRGRSRVLLDAVVGRVSGGAGVLDGSGPKALSPEAGVCDAVAALPPDTAVLQYALFPTAVTIPGSWVLFVQVGGEDSPSVAMETEQLDSVWGAKEKLDAEADRIENFLTQVADVSLPLSQIMSGVNKILAEESGYINALEKLSDLLLPSDVVERLAREGVKRLVVSPDSYLYEIPWMSLTPLVGGARRPLIGDDEWEGFGLAIVPNIASFLMASTLAGGRGANDSARVLLAADPLGDLSEVDPLLRPVLDEITNTLEGADCAVTRLDGPQVTKAEFICAGQTAEAMIYVGHAAAAPQDVGGGAVMLLSDGNAGVGLLSSDELAQLTGAPVFGRCEVAVLLACSSGQASKGGWGSDREVNGLATAYLLQGCLSVIAPARPMMLTPGLIFLNGFVRELTGGKMVGESVRLALRQLAGACLLWSHPFFWGHIALYGTLDGGLGGLTRTRERYDGEKG